MACQEENAVFLRNLHKLVGTNYSIMQLSSGRMSFVVSMNTAANAASAISSVVFGYLVSYFGSYNAPLVPMVGFLCVGAWLWLRIDATRQLIEPDRDVAVVGVRAVV